MHALLSGRPRPIITMIVALLASAALVLAGATPARAGDAYPAVAGVSWQAPQPFDRAHGGVPNQVSCAPGTTTCVAVDQDSAVTRVGARWGAPVRIAPDPVGNGLSTVSCPTATFCAAMGDNGQEAPFSTYFAVLRGGTWTPTVLSGSATGGASLSCASDSSCWGIGYDAELYHYDGTGWTTSAAIEAGDVGMQAIACPSAGFCVAVGNSGWYSVYRGGSWSPLTSLGHDADLRTVSCSSARFCVAGSGAGAAYVYDGTTWSAGTAVTPSGLVEVSCPVGRWCAAATGDGGAAVLDGTTWTGSTIAAGSRLTSISCAARGSCTAVDVEAEAFRLRAGTWSAPTVMDHRQGNPSDVSCWNVQRCRAVDRTGTVWTYTGKWTRTAKLGQVDDGDDLSILSCPSAIFCMVESGISDVRSFDGTTWNATTPALPAHAFVRAMTCASATFCMALNDWDEYAVYDGTSWSTPGHVAGNNGGFLTVSCPSSTYCVAGSTSGQTFTWNGSTWSAPTQTSTEVIWSVSCASSAFCVAVGNGGSAYLRTTGPTWTASVLDADGGQINDVSCPQVGRCVAVGGDVTAYGFDGARWAGTALTVTGDFASAVSCWRGPGCVLITNQGDAVATA